MKTGRACVILGLAALGVAGCGEETLDEKQLESEVKTVLAQQVGQEPKAIDCPGDLPAKKGEKMTCTLVAQDGSEVDAFVTVNSTDGDKAKFTVEVGDEVRR